MLTLASKEKKPQKRTRLIAKRCRLVSRHLKKMNADSTLVVLVGKRAVKLGNKTSFFPSSNKQIILILVNTPDKKLKIEKL